MIDLMICCNNQQGKFIGKIAKIEFHHNLETLISFESSDDSFICDCKIYNDNLIRMDKKVFRYSSYRYYVGNIMWDCYYFIEEQANSIWEMLLSLKDNIHCKQGLNEFWNAWEYGLKVNFKKLKKE